VPPKDFPTEHFTTDGSDCDVAADFDCSAEAASAPSAAAASAIDATASRE
jgi:hypothetical protein